jgi:hypothetical protein
LANQSDVTAVNVPGGGVIASRAKASLPQQASVPSVRTAQACALPADSAVNVPAGGLALPLALEPQQARVASVRIAQAKEPPAATAVKVPAGADRRRFPWSQALLAISA